MAKEKTEKFINRAFTNMLTNTLRNHYTLNQMVDRKARILLTINVVVLSFIIGKVIGNQFDYSLNFLVLLGGGIACVISIVYSVLAVMPENNTQNLTEETLKTGELNPLYFGNYLSMSLESYESTMMEMVDDLRFPHRAMLKDLYFIGSILERKRKYLRYSLITMTVGICGSLVLSIILRFVAIG
jgi:hypothetical protein